MQDLTKKRKIILPHGRGWRMQNRKRWQSTQARGQSSSSALLVRPPSTYLQRNVWAVVEVPLSHDYKHAKVCVMRATRFFVQSGICTFLL